MVKLKICIDEKGVRRKEQEGSLDSFKKTETISRMRVVSDEHTTRRDH